MSDYFQNMNFSGYPFYIRLVFDFIFFKNLDGDFLTSYKMSAQSNFSKSSLAKRSTYNKFKFKDHKL